MLDRSPWEDKIGIMRNRDFMLSQCDAMASPFCSSRDVHTRCGCSAGATLRVAPWDVVPEEGGNLGVSDLVPRARQPRATPMTRLGGSFFVRLWGTFVLWRVCYVYVFLRFGMLALG